MESIVRDKTRENIELQTKLETQAAEYSARWVGGGGDCRGQGEGNCVKEGVNAGGRMCHGGVSLWMGACDSGTVCSWVWLQWEECDLVSLEGNVMVEKFDHKYQWFSDYCKKLHHAPTGQSDNISWYVCNW